MTQDLMDERDVDLSYSFSDIVPMAVLAILAK
jgi:hypothetical protein